jgi:hypothetical protein
MFKNSANGVDIFCKVPTMIKPAINKWEIDQQREFLKLKSGKVYVNLIEAFKSKNTSFSACSNMQYW